MSTHSIVRGPDIEDAVWDDLVARSRHATVFVRSDWLACFGRAFERRAVADADGRYTAGFVVQTQGSTVGNIGVTPYQGLILPVGPSGTLPRAERTAALLLAEDVLGSGWKGHVRCQPGLLDLKALVWAGAALSLRLTHQISPGPPDQQWSRLASQVRGHVRRGDRHGLVNVSTTDLHPLRELIEATFTPWFDVEEEFASLSSAVDSGLLSVQMAVRAGEVQGAIAIGHGKTFDHYLLSGRSSRAVSGTMPWLIWRAIHEALDQGKAFDFEGSMIPGVSQFYDQFGGHITPVAELILV